MQIIDHDKLEYFCHLCQLLSASEQRLYEYLKMVGAGSTSFNEIQRNTRTGDPFVRKTLKRLEKLDLLRYTVTPVGVYIEWVSQFKGDRPPSRDALYYHRKARGYRLKDPQGKVHCVEPGRLRQFCETHQLNYRNVWGVCNGERKTHKGWVVATNPGHARTA